MKKVSISVAVLATLFSVQGLYAFGHGYDGLTGEEILLTIPEGKDKRADDLSVAELTALAEKASIARQEDRYESRAEFLSFVVPGTGQFAVGDYAGGFLRLGAEIAIIAGTATAYWYLLPEDLQHSSLSRSERRDIRQEYWESGDGAKLLPSMAVAATGFALSIANRVLASQDAGKTARSNIDSGKVTFEPKIYLNGARFGFGLRMRIR